MDDTHNNRRSGSRHDSLMIGRGVTAVWMIVLLFLGIAGCSLFVMTGKAIFGDPKVTSLFRKQTRVDLTKAKKKVVVICSFPEAARAEYSGVAADIVLGVTLRLKREGIPVVRSSKVADFLDENNGVFDDMDELAEAFDADYIIHIDLTEFTHRADNSPGMYQGRTIGNVSAYRIVKQNGVKEARDIFSQEFKSVYPPHNPISVSRKSERTFLSDYIRRISTELAQLFYDHHFSETIH